MDLRREYLPTFCFPLSCLQVFSYQVAEHPPWLLLQIHAKGKLNKPFQNWIIPKGKYVSVIHTLSSANLGVNYAERGV